MNEIHYKIPWRASSSFPGFHASQQKGGGLQFRNHVPLIDAPDPRRFDIRASLHDPFGQIRVRVYQQTSTIPVYVVADLSASMRFKGQNSKMSVLADFVASMSYSAYRTGDTFGFVGCGETPSKTWHLPSTLNRAAGLELADELRSFEPTSQNSEGLLYAVENLGSRRALVFLLSDFHFPFKFAETLMASLVYHDVVPVMLWDKQEYQDFPSFGFVSFNDAETEQNRILFMRPSLKKSIQTRFLQRRENLFKLLGQYGRVPLLLDDGFHSDEVTHYFYS